jgi:fructokinase
LNNILYLTVGTGIGGGGLINGRPIHGLIHPEMGHIAMSHDWTADPFPGHCPYHGDCLEGLASGSAMNARWKQRPETLPPEHPAWELEAHYLALALRTFICTLSPERIMMGGGVMQQPQLLAAVRRKVLDYLNGYVQSPAILSDTDHYIVAPRLGTQAGVLGAIALAKMKLE